MARKTMASWIDEALVDPEKSGRISALAVVHMIGQQQQELYITKLGATGNYDGERLAKILEGKARVHCQDSDTVQRFALLAFYDGKSEFEAIFPFKLLPERDPATLGLSTEEPTEEGRTRQKMRQADDLHTQVYQRQAVMDSHAIRMLEQQDKMLGRSQTMLEKVMADNMEAFNIVKELLIERSLGQHNHAMELEKEQRASKREEQFLKFLPAAVNGLAGKEIVPQSLADTALVETIAENITPEMIAKIAELGLPPMVMGTLSARVMKFMEEKEKRQAAENKPLPPYAGNAEKDIDGGA